MNDDDPTELDNEYSDLRRVQAEAGFVEPTAKMMAEVAVTLTSRGFKAAWRVMKKNWAERNRRVIY